MAPQILDDYAFVLIRHEWHERWNKATEVFSNPDGCLRDEYDRTEWSHKSRMSLCYEKRPIRYSTNRKGSRLQALQLPPVHED
jgi:hypothetical protein